MADNIVGGLFGVDPAALQRQQQLADQQTAYRYAQLDPMQQAKFSQFSGAAGLTRGVGGLLGMEDPELAKASKIKQIVSQIDITNPDGLRQLAAAIKDFAPQEAMMAAAEADKREQTGLGLQKTKADISKAELSAANEEKLRAELSALPPNASEQQVIEVVRKYGSPDKILAILTASQDRATARAVAASNKANAPSKPLSAGLQKAEDADLAKIDNFQAQSDALLPSIQNLTKDEKGMRALELNPSNIAKYVAQNAIGRSTPESQKYAALKSAVDTAVNLQVSAEKGVQTDKDVLRFANALIAAYGKYDTEATLQALENYNKAVLKQKTNTQRIIQSRRKQQGVDPYEFTDSVASSPSTQTKEVDFSTLPKRK